MLITIVHSPHVLLVRQFVILLVMTYPRKQILQELLEVLLNMVPSLVDAKIRDALLKKFLIPFVLVAWDSLPLIP